MKIKLSELKDMIENVLLEEKSILKEETINDFFNMIEKDPRKNTIAYVYYTMPVSVNKFMLDENGNKIPNPMFGKIFKNKQIKFNYAETFKEVMNKRDPDYVLGKKSGNYEKLDGYDVIESGKSGLYMPVLPKSSKTVYSILDNGEWKLVKKEEIQKYLKPETQYVDTGKPIINQLIVDRIARIAAGGHVWNNPNFIYKYMGPKSETFEPDMEKNIEEIRRDQALGPNFLESKQPIKIKISDIKQIVETVIKENML